ncbi:MAG: LysR family transcriptional regulator [Nannocystaceae bacterium]|nr:LysR family transcriptional regulator [Nannocystaceae bacterium]
MSLPSLESLRCFVAIAHRSSFRKGSEHVGLTPTALSQRIRQLEEQLGERVFDRTSRSVQLTAAGRRLLPHAEALLEQALRVGPVARGESGDEAPARIRLGTRFELGISWLVPIVAELRSRRPLWKIELYFGSGADLLGRLRAQKLEAIITSAPVADARWHAEVLHPETYVLVASESIGANIKTPEDLAEHVLVDISAELPLARYMLSACPSMTFAEVWPCGSSAAVEAMVAQGLGVGVLPRHTVQDKLGGPLTQLLPDLPFLADTFRLLFEADTPLDPQLRALADELRAVPLR